MQKKYYVKHTFIFEQIVCKPVTVTDVWEKFSNLDIINHSSSAISKIRPQTLNARWKTIRPVCVTRDNSTNWEMSVSTEIIALAHEIGGLNEIDINESLVNDPPSDDDIIETLFVLVNDPENNSEDNDNNPSLFTAKIYELGLQLCKKLAN